MVTSCWSPKDVFKDLATARRGCALCARRRRLARSWALWWHRHGNRAATLGNGARTAKMRGWETGGDGEEGDGVGESEVDGRGSEEGSLESWFGGFVVAAAEEEGEGGESG